MSVKDEKIGEDAELTSKSVSGGEDVYYIDPVAEKKLLRKLDFILLPLFMLLYATNFVDRTAVGVYNSVYPLLD